MKISLWQQFSSNHSGSFTVIGRFDRPEKAEAVGSQFRRLMDENKSWVEAIQVAFRDVDQIITAQGGGNRMKILAQRFPELAVSPAQKFFAKYDVEWDESVIDWSEGDYDRSELVKIVGSDVYVMTNNEESNWLPTPIRAVFGKLGALAVQSEQTGSLTCIGITVKGNGPDPETARGIRSIVRANLDWVASKERAYRTGESPLPEPETPWIPSNLPAHGEIAWLLRRNYAMVDGRMLMQTGSLADTQFMFEVQFKRAGYGIPAFLNWLHSFGCTDLEYKFVEVRC
jgi:hypothetical protein